MKLFSFALGAASGLFLLIPGSLYASTSVSEFIELSGESSGDYAGWSVAPAGDVDGDGFDDVLVGASYATTENGTNTGAAYLVYGSEDELTSASLSEHVKFSGEAEYDFAGWSLAGGDLNNDGYDDLVIGAHCDDDGGSCAGAVYVVYGQSEQLTSMSLGDAVKLTGEAASDQAGRSVGVGDFNGDGFADIVVGASGNDDGSTDGGSVYVVYGEAAELVSQSLSGAAQLAGQTAEYYMGVNVSNAGDVNADGYDDVLIGGYPDALEPLEHFSYTKAYLVYGKADDLTTADLSTAVTESISNIDAYTVYGVGDINADSFADFALSYVWANQSFTFLNYGQVDEDELTETELTGSNSNTCASCKLFPAGDVDHDGYGDLLIGSSSNDDAATNAGAVFLMLGSDSQLTETAFDTAEEFTGEAESDQLGYSANSAGDLNGDGTDEIILGAPYNDDGEVNAGAVYIAYVYLDEDGDGTPGSGGLLAGDDANDNDYDNDGVETEEDCDDENAAISSGVTFYLDADGDGLGDPDTTKSKCRTEALDGYVINNNDTNDSSADDLGVELSDDEVDNDGDGQIDEANLVSENGLHPAYLDLDPADTAMYALAVSEVRGGKNGYMRVEYSDGSIYRFRVFELITNKKTKISSYNNTGYILVLNHRGKKLALVNAYTGEVFDREQIAEKRAYDKHSMIQYDFRTNGEKEVALIQKKKKHVLVSVVSVSVELQTVTKEDHLHMTKRKVRVGKTAFESNRIFLRDGDLNVLVTLRVSNSLKLKVI